MRIMGEIKGILIDSGRVLNVSATGSWSYSPNFFNIVGEENFKSISEKKRDLAYEKAWKYINSISLIETIGDEDKHFYRFFEILSEELKELKIDKEKIESLTKDMVYNFDKYIFFDDVLKVIPELSKEYKLCLVSDAWPSLRGVYKKAGLDKYFSEIIISSEIGATKPNERMYKEALKRLNLKACEVIFIDDNIKNCDGATSLGIRSIVLDRVLVSRLHSRFILRTKNKIVKNLEELKKII